MNVPGREKPRRRPPRVMDDLTRRLLNESLPLLTPEARSLAAATRIFVVNSRVGRAAYRTGTATVPGWVFKPKVHFCSRVQVEGGPAFAAYYLAHELAHILSRSRDHGPAFMAAFQRLCPVQLQFYEHAYKPRRAKDAGVAMADAA